MLRWIQGQQGLSLTDELRAPLQNGSNAVEYNFDGAWYEPQIPVTGRQAVYDPLAGLAPGYNPFAPANESAPLTQGNPGLIGLATSQQGTGGPDLERRGKSSLYEQQEA